MLDTHTKNSLSDERITDITCWEEVTLTGLNARQKRRFLKHKAAVTAYFTTDASLDEITKQQDISASSLLAMTQKCLMRHADGRAWGFRALLPGANVVDHVRSVGQETPTVQETLVKRKLRLDDEDTTERPALVLTESVKIPTILSFHETPSSTPNNNEPIDESGSMTGASPVTTIDQTTSKSRLVAEESIVVTGLAPVMPSSPVVLSPSTLPLETKVSIPIPTILSFPFPMPTEEAPVGAHV